MKKDIVLRYTVYVLTESWTNYFDKLHQFTFIRLVLQFASWLWEIDVLEIIWKWLRKEAFLVIMKIEYLCNKLQKVFKSAFKLSEFIHRVLDRTGLGFLVLPFLNMFKRFKKTANVELLTKISETTG
mmetsp:Transcript_35004/g.6300  ORF Transcript_35004/g.6300 Transcript_35004/m.6300 type:complete len:127 (+) Transcript_35004:611-991(+)